MPGDRASVGYPDLQGAAKRTVSGLDPHTCSLLYYECSSYPHWHVHRECDEEALLPGKNAYV
jgi:hypothetical protein